MSICGVESCGFKSHYWPNYKTGDSLMVEYSSWAWEVVGSNPTHPIFIML